ncbi:hypothetical protein ZIOFF_039470 [Zingiber officinale]|uniref:2-oxo-4-hydroxy-4-carboxy-5-ureidoimidazoline decarboxylase n=1 Tax=Zingiber officinale TaxID=94328 RepID=A0A8J5G752_ZINOF|nr:hypothetical protein ZIOFF_039470 [Zingiber officinale]
MASFSWTKEDVLRCCGSKCFTKELASASSFFDLHHAMQSAYGIWWSKEEQSAAMATTNDTTLQELVDWNIHYQEKFGFVFLIYASGRGTLEILVELKEQSEELAHTFVDQIDSKNSYLGYIVSGSKANSASIHQSAVINSSRVVHAQEFDANILYHIHEYAQSLSVLKKLFQNIEPIEEQIAVRVCLLLLDVALACEDILQVSFTNLKYSRVEIDEV